MVYLFCILFMLLLSHVCIFFRIDMAFSILVIALLTSTTLEKIAASSQFQSDASFSVVDTDLSTVIPTIVPTTAALTTAALTTAASIVTTANWAATAALTTSAATTLLEDLNPLTGFDDPPPVLLRGDNGLDPATGIFRIVDDGSYVFIIHRVGFDGTNPTLELTVVPASDPTTNTTLATLEDTGENTIFTTHVVANLRRGDVVVISNAQAADVEGTDDNPFIYNAFLLYREFRVPFFFR